MKKHLSLIVIAGILLGLAALPALAQDKKDKEELIVTGQIDAGAQMVGEVNRSSKFYEYRDVPQGFIFNVFNFSLAKGSKYLILNADRIRQSDSRYDLSFGDYGKFKVDLSWDKIPHRYSYEAKTLYSVGPAPAPGNGVFDGDVFYYGVSDTIQSSLQALTPGAAGTGVPTAAGYLAARNLLSGYLTGVHAIPLGLQRNKGGLYLEYSPSVPLTLSLDLSHETRKGNRAIGASYGLSNAVEMPEPIDFTTDNIDAKVEMNKSWGSVRAGYAVSLFENENQAMIWDNVYMLTDRAYAGAYQMGLAGSKGQMALWPSNHAQRLYFGGNANIFKHTRVTASFSIGSFSQNEKLLPYTINTALAVYDPTRPTLPYYDGALSAPRPTAMAKANVGSMDLTLNSRLFRTNAVTGWLTAGFRYYDFANKTELLDMPGFSVADQVWTIEEHSIEPHSYTRSRAFADFTLNLVENTSLKVGYQRGWMDRQTAGTEEGLETDKSHEDSFKVSADSHPADWFMVRVSYLNSKRVRDLDSEEILYPLPPTAPPGTPEFGFRRYYDANRNRDVVNFLVGFTPFKNLDLELAYGNGKDVYPTADYGLLDSLFKTYTVDLSYALGRRASIYGFYTYEHYDSNMASRQSGATRSIDPLDDWTLNLQDKVDTIGGGFNTAIIKNKLNFDISYNYSKVKGTGDFYSPPGGAVVGDAVNFTDNNFDTTKLQTLRTQLLWKFTKTISVALNYWYETYDLADITRTDMKVDMVVAGYGMYLGALEPGYKYHVGSVTFSYIW